MESIDLSGLRKDYILKELWEKDMPSLPVDELNIWLEYAIKSNVLEPSAMHLCTVGANGRPSSRIVLLKGLSERGLVFFTNYESKKGKEISSNKFASITFFWPELERQVRIEGKIEKTTREVSENYFHSRPPGSQLSATVSPQSAVIADREQLIAIKAKLEIEFKNKELPCPHNWGGYILEPDYYEFWQGRQDRLHDRIIYERKNENWLIQRLAP